MSYTGPIPLRLLPLRATVRRINPSNGIFENVYTDVPCRIARNLDQPNEVGSFVTSETEIVKIFANRQLSGADLQIIYKDHFIIGSNTYSILSATDSASEEHHLEMKAEHLKTMQTDP